MTTLKNRMYAVLNKKKVFIVEDLNRVTFAIDLKHCKKKFRNHGKFVKKANLSQSLKYIITGKGYLK